MHTLSRPKRRNRSGYALIMIMCFLVVCLLVFASTMYWISSNSSVTSRNNQFNMSEAAAEAATEKVLSQMNYDYVAQSLSNNGAYYGSKVPSAADQANWLWPVSYVYSDTNGVANQISVNFGAWTTNTVPLNSQFTGLYGEEMPVTITATATPIGQRFTVPSTVSESLQFASIPLFQFAIFYNMNLEIAAAQTLNVVGPVWSNGGIWSGSTTVSFLSTVSAVGIATNTANDPFCSGYTGSGKSTYSVAGQPTGGNDRITMPIGTNNDPNTIEALVNLPPAPYTMNTASAFTTNGQQYLANGADLYLTNFANGTNWGTLTPKGTNMILYYQDGANTPYLTQVPYDFFIMTNRFQKNIFFTNVVSLTLSTNINCVTNIIYAGYTFVTNDIFYDWREGWNGGSGPAKAVQAVQIDVSRFNVWLANTNMPDANLSGTNVNGGAYYNTQCLLSSHKSHPIDSIYVYNDVPLTSTTLPAVRLVNGGILPTHTAPYGFTLATAMPIYVWGNYNASNVVSGSLHSGLGTNSTTYTWPAGLMGDAITILSGNWTDTGSSKTTGGPSAGSGATTVNAAILAGIVPSTNSLYSGGVENFLRTLENWGSATLWYNGSIVVMFPSRYATNFWQQTGNYYTAPNRHWAFDTNFMQQGGLPPLTPQSKGVIRATWNAY
jgi:Tfp pilus assembly protein PilX